MERAIISNKMSNKFTLESKDSKFFLLDLNNYSEKVELTVSNNSNVDILILNLHDDSIVHFDVLDNAYLHVALLDHKSTKNFKISANVGLNSTFSAHFADFIVGECKGEVLVNLNKEGASCDWHLASLTEKNDKKEFDVSVYHNSPRTFAQMDNYGVCRDEGRLAFSGICQIYKGAHGSKAHQNAKIMVFDRTSHGVAKPILKIDENDIEASHAAIVGKINDEHIFYLTSRGLTEDEAKRLITLGYLKPILNGFADDDIKKTIEDLIEGKM